MPTLQVSYQTGWLNQERAVVAMNDGGSWLFSADGIQQRFEEPESYKARRIADRFTDYLGLMLIPGSSKAEEAVHVYQIVKDGKVIYVGITNNPERRAIEHGVSKLDEIVIASSRDQARAVEQALIQHHGLEKNGGTLKNKINSISSKRPGFWDSVALGFQILRNIGYVF